MRDESKTKAMLIQELETLRQQVREQQVSDSHAYAVVQGNPTRHRTDAGPDEPESDAEPSLLAFLRESRMQLQALLDSMQEGLVVQDGEGIIRLCNASAERILGFPAGQLVGSALMDPKWRAIHEDGSDFPNETFPIMRALHAGETLHNVLLGLPKPNEEVLWLSINAAPLFRPGDACPRAALATFNDITDVRQTERALRRANRRLNNILDSMTDAYFSLDRDWRFTYLNPKAEQLFERRRKELLGQNIWECFPDLTNSQVYQECYRAFAKQVAIALEEYNAAYDKWLKIYLYPSQDGLSIYVQDLTEQRKAEQEIRQSLEKLHKTINSIARAMARTAELRDPYTAGHQRRVAALSCVIAREMGLSEERIDTLRIAGLLHDIGKISIPVEILSKPGRLSAAELSIIQMHAQVGYDILKDIDFPAPIALVALQHHERLDGSGYPSGLRGEEILLEAQITGVADVVEAMASHRPYRPSLGIETALEEILKHKETRYCAPAVEACLNALTQYGFDFEHLLQSEGA